MDGPRRGRAQDCASTKGELDPEFFNLRSGVAGELMQKCVNYRSCIALVIRDPARYGERFSELALEHRTHPIVRFFGSREDVEQWLRTAG